MRSTTARRAQATGLCVSHSTLITVGPFELSYARARLRYYQVLDVRIAGPKHRCMQKFNNDGTGTSVPAGPGLSFAVAVRAGDRREDFYFLI